MFLYMGAPLRMLFEDEKAALLKQIDDEFEKVYWNSIYVVFGCFINVPFCGINTELTAVKHLNVSSLLLNFKNILEFYLCSVINLWFTSHEFVKIVITL